MNWLRHAAGRKEGALPRSLAALIGLSVINLRVMVRSFRLNVLLKMMDTSGSAGT